MTAVALAGPHSLLSTHHDYKAGRVLVILSGVVMSVGAPVVRLLESATALQLLAYRSLSVCLMVGLFLLVQHRGRLPAVIRSAGLRSLLAGAFLALAFISIVFSILNTTIANALFMMATAPFITALLGWVLLGERPSRLTWIAIAGAIAGIFVMLGEGLADGDLFGDLTGLGAAAAFACYSVTIRGGRDRDMGPSVFYAGLFSGVVAAACALIGGSGLAASAWDIGVSFVYGGVGISGGLVLYTLGSKHVPAAELNLLSLGEMALAPLWVWIGFAEVPSVPTLVGGGILLAAICVQALGTSFPDAQHPRSPANAPWLPFLSIAAGTALIGIALARALLA